MNLKTTGIALLAALAISGCAQNANELQTTASAETIQAAKDALKDQKDATVFDNGVIEYRYSLEGGYRWARVQIKEISYRVACENLKWFTDRGMIVRMTFLGNSGMLNDYDKKRCETEVPTDLYAPKS